MKEESQAGRAYSEIRKQILSNQLGSGTRLKEDEWSKRLEINRSGIREALTRLTGEQLLVSGEKGGFFVRPFTIEDLTDTSQLRELLEVGALQLAIAIITPEKLDEMEATCDDFSAMIAKGYFGGALEADMRFHELLIEASGNQKLKNVYKISNIPLLHQKVGKFHTHVNHYRLTDKEHRQIVKALRDKDLKLATETLVAHLRRGKFFL